MSPHTFLQHSSSNTDFPVAGCPSDPALGTTLTTDFTKGVSTDWSLADGTIMSYDPTEGAQFSIDTATTAPTISSEKYIFFGKVDVVMKACAGQGIVSSFILESDDLDEIDWEWIGSVDTSVETNFFGKGNTSTYNRATYADVTDPVNTFHKYTIDWTSERIVWSINDDPVRTLLYSDPVALSGQNYPQTPMRVKMGNWVGCASAAAASDPASAGTCTWAQGPADFSQGPFVMNVQSVTIEDYGCAESYSYGDTSGSFGSIVSTGGCAPGGSGSESSAVASSTVVSSVVSYQGSSTGSVGASATGSGSASASGTANVTSSAAVTSASASVSAASNATASATGASTLTSLIVATGTASKTGSGAPSTTSPATLASPSTSAGNSKYGLLDYAVVVMGLGLGYLVM